MLTSVGKEDVAHAMNCAALDVVAVSLPSGRIDQRLGVSESHHAPGTAACLEHRIRVRRMRLVQQNRGRRPRGDHQITGPAQKRAVGFYTRGTTDACEALLLLLHPWYGSRLELPTRDLAIAARRHRSPLGASNHLGAAPPTVSIVRPLPSPRISRGVDRIAGSRGVIVSHEGGGDDDRRVRPIAQHFPTSAGVDERRFRGAVALKKESGAVAELRDRTRRTPVPHQRRDHVAPGVQIWREIDRLVAPVADVRALRPRRHLHAVDVQPVSIVGGHVHHESRGHRRQLQRPPRVEYGEGIPRRSSDRDPASRRRPVEYARLLRADRRRKRDDRRECEARDKRPVRLPPPASAFRTISPNLLPHSPTRSLSRRRSNPWRQYRAERPARSVHSSSNLPTLLLLSSGSA
jgi:hypothetical protein